MAKPFDPTKPAQTKGGLKAEYLTTLSGGASYPLAYKITLSSGKQTIYRYTEEGYLDGKEFPDHEDLVNLPEIDLKVGDIVKLKGGDIAVVTEDLDNLDDHPMMARAIGNDGYLSFAKNGRIYYRNSDQEPKDVSEVLGNVYDFVKDKEKTDAND